MDKEKLIYRHFHGSLSDEEQQEFNRLLKEDLQFQRDLEFEEQTKKAIISIKKDELESHLNEMETDSKKTNKTSYFWAATIIIAVGITSYILFNQPNFSNDQLYAEYFEPYPNIIAPPVRGKDSISKIQEDFLAYEKGDFKSAAVIFEKRYQQKRAPYYLFYQGVSELQLGNTEKAIAVFEKQIAEHDRFENYSKWYLALAYLKINEAEKYEPLLNKIIKEKSFKYQSAKKILKKIQ